MFHEHARDSAGLDVDFRLLWHTARGADAVGTNKRGDGMKTMKILPMRSIALRAIREMAIDGILGAVSGGLFGLVFGGFGALLHGESWKLVSIAGYFALCGAVAGAVMGAWSAILNEGAKTPDSTSHSPMADSEIATVRKLIVPSQRWNATSLPTVSTPDRRRMLSGVSSQPLSC
jgi:hypothetical protein